MAAPYDKTTSYPGSTDVGIYARYMNDASGEIWDGAELVAWDDDDVADYSVRSEFIGGGVYGHNVPADLPAGRYTVRFYKPAAADADGALTDLKLPDEWLYAKGGAIESDDSTRPVVWEEAKAHLRLFDDTDQTYVESLIDAAADFAESRMGCTLMQRTRTHVIYDGQRLELPYGPVASITTITDDNDAPITATIETLGNMQRLNISTAGYAFPLTVTYVAGYASRSSIPAAIRLAILQHVATLYENRESVSDRAKMSVPHTLESFYRYKSRLSGVA